MVNTIAMVYEKNIIVCEGNKDLTKDLIQLWTESWYQMQINSQYGRVVLISKQEESCEAC